MVNYLAVLVSAVAAFAVGAIWYGPLFGKRWQELMGLTAPEVIAGMKSNAAKAMTGGFIATLVLTFVLENLFVMFGIVTIGAALMVAFWIWLGFVATIMLNSVWYENRPLELYLINVSHYFVALLIAALILAWWPW